MNNPWTKKNPVMSMWLSAANSMMGSARGQASAQAKRQGKAVAADATKQVIDFWMAPAKPARKRRAK